jgi:hypothetical protein
MMAEAATEMTTVQYAGHELEALAEARNYYRWILQQFRPFLGRRILEFGAGSGTFASHLLTCDPESLWAFEPAPKLRPQLEARLGRHPAVRITAGTLIDLRDRLGDEQLDTIVSVNVLEHVLDDREALRVMRSLLGERSGHLLLYVPALPWLYNSLDRAFGHYRRYCKSELRAKVLDAGFEPIRCRYVHAVGMLGWWYTGVILRRRTFSRRAVGWYDRNIFPIAMALEHRLSPPFGQSLLVIARAAVAAG